MRRTFNALLVAALAATGSLAGSVASAADLVVGVYASDPGACADARVLGKISERFRYQVRHVPNLPNVAIVDFFGIGETRYLPRREKWPIERRYCHAKVALTDGRSRSIWYLIEHPMGFASIGSNVEFCVSGFDRWHVYNGNCRVLR
jgi:hypothetical protein